MVGIWDNEHSSPPLAPRDFPDGLRAAAEAGKVFLLNTGADCGGWLEIYLDSEMPPELQRKCRPIGGELLVLAPSGQLVIGGAEDYRAKETSITDEHSVVAVPKGRYGVCCFQVKPGVRDATPAMIMRDQVGDSDMDYFEKVNEMVLCCSLPVLILYSLFVYLWNWWIALPLTLVPFISFFWFADFVLRRNQRYVRLEKKHHEAFEESEQRVHPLFVFQLRASDENERLSGGEVGVY